LTSFRYLRDYSIKSNLSKRDYLIKERIILYIIMSLVTYNLDTANFIIRHIIEEL